MPRSGDGGAAYRLAPAQLSREEFTRLGHRLIDQLGEFLAALPARSVRTEQSAERIRDVLAAAPFPAHGMQAELALDGALELLRDNAISTSHPRFWGYIMGAASPVGALADLLASVTSPPVTSYPTCGITVALEAQTVRWIAELLGYPADGGGLFLDGGSMANLVALRAALQAKAGWDVRRDGLTCTGADQLRLYTSSESHSSIRSAASICGLGARAVRLVPADPSGAMRAAELERMIAADRAEGLRPFFVVGTAGTTGTGAVDPMHAIGALCRAQDLWFHADGAYGGFAVVSRHAPAELRGMLDADSLAVDPHKWLYMPADIGCLLTRDRRILFETFREDAPYYAESDDQAVLGGPETLQMRDLGPQTTRSLRALKVRMFLQTFGRDGYRQMVDDDIELARRLHATVAEDPELEPLTCQLSITTFRYVPRDLRGEAGAHRAYLNQLNKAILHELRATGAAFPSHTSSAGVFALRVCIVNCNTTLADIDSLPPAVRRLGAALDARLRPAP